jgi:hypothetical protein
VSATAAEIVQTAALHELVDEHRRLRIRVATLEARLAWALEEADSERAAFAMTIGLGRRPRGRVWSRRALARRRP